MEYRSFSSRYGQSSSRAAFPPSPLQKYLSTPRYEAKYKRRSLQYAPRVRHKMAFINGRLVKVYNSAWLADYESHEKKLDVTGKTNQLLILSPYRQFGSSHDVSTIKKSPATLELPTSSGYHSSLSVPSSPFLARRSDNEPNRCFSYNELYSPKSPSTPRRFGLGTRRTYSASDLSSSPSFDRSFGFPPYSPNYRRWTSNYDISFFPDHYSSTDYLNSYRKAGSCDVLFPPSPSSLDWRTLSRLEGGSLGYDFRSRTGSGSFIRKSRLDLDYQADGYCSHTQSECDFPVRYQGPSSKSECGVSPNDVATRSESGISIALSDFDSSFVGADEETASVGSADRSMDRSLDNLSVFPLDFDLERCDTESVMSYDRTLDIVYEDENSDPDQEGDGASGKQDRGKSSASANLLSRFERASMRTFGSDVQQQEDVDDDVFRQHTDILYISDGANVQMDDTDSQHVSNNPDDEFRQHTDIMYISDGANVQMDDTDSQHVSNNPDDEFRQHTDIMYISDGANVQIDDTDSQHVSNNPVDEFRQHTDILYISDGANVQIDDTDSQHVSNNPDDEFRQHTDILYLRDGANVHVDDTDSQHVSNNPDDEFRQHTDILYIHDGANVHVDDTDSQHVSNNPDDEFRQHMDILYISDGANVHVDETDSKQGVQGSQLEDSRQHTKTLYVTDLSNSQQDDAETSGIVINRVTIEAEDRCEGVTEVAETQVMVKAGNDLHVTRSQSADVSVVGADVSVVGADVSVVGADVSVVGADMRHHSLHLHGDSGLLQQDTEDERHHTDILYLSDAGNVYTEDNHENVATESETHNNVRQHSDKKSNFDLSVLKENTKSENVTEMEDDALRQHTQTIYFTDSNSVFQEDTCDTKSLIIIEAENDTFRQHTHTVHVIDSVRDNDEIRQHTDIVYITDEDNQVIADDEDMRHRTDTVFIRDTGNQQFDEGVHGIADEDEGSSDNIHRHTETLCLIHKDNVDDDDDQSTDESSESDDDSLTQHRQIVYVKDEGDKLVDDGVSDVDYVRSGTETLYVYQSASGQEDNEQFNSDISALERSEEFEIIEMPETLYEHQSESGDEVLVDEDNVRSDTQTMYIHQCTSSQKDNQQLDSDITELEISAIERSEEFEVIEMPETLLSSSFINSSERHRNILEDSLNYIDPFNDSTGVYSRNISVEYDRADQQALDEFIDEREITTSSQIHLALEETADEDSYYRSDNDVRGRSSDEDYADDISSHRLLVQSDRDSSIESEVNVSTSENMDVKQTASTLNEFNTRGNLASGLSPGTLPADCSESSSRYTVINRVSMEAEDRCEGVTEVAETQVMVKAGSDIQSHNVTEFIIQSTSEVFGDENKVPHLLNAVPNETQARSKKPEPGLETDEHSRSRDSNENRRLTGVPNKGDASSAPTPVVIKSGGSQGPPEKPARKSKPDSQNLNNGRELTQAPGPPVVPTPTDPGTKVRQEDHDDDEVTPRINFRNWDPSAVLKDMYTVRLMEDNAEDISHQFIAMEGYMEKLPMNKKKSTLLKTWKRRFFKAVDGWLYYYESSNRDKPSDTVQLMGGRIDDMSNRILGIDDGRGKFLMVRCPTEREHGQWKLALESQTADNTKANYIRPALRANPHPQKKVVIIDLGSTSVRAGILGDKATLPTLFFPSVVAVHKTTDDLVVGSDAYKPNVRLQSVISHPISPSNKVDKDHCILPVSCMPCRHTASWSNDKTLLIILHQNTFGTSLTRQLPWLPHGILYTCVMKYHVDKGRRVGLLSGESVCLSHQTPRFESPNGYSV
ncbi:uncharacterized protein [Haliotis asinina]|uniref:uncharacterized protein isoform X2 n=1 Tax=Haliotis asinina TaxID=109174 RepID=UPI003532483A